MKKLKVALMLLSGFVANAQQVSWAKDITTYKYGNNNTAVYDNQGNLFVAGSYTDSIKIGATVYHTLLPSNSEMYFAKYDTSGNLLWHTVVPGKASGSANDLAADASGNIYFAARGNDSLFFGSIKIKGKGVVYGKMNNSGVFQWVKTNTDGFATPNGIYVDGNTNVYITGGYFNGSQPLELDATYQAYSNDLGGGSYGDMFVAKIDGNGNAQWLRSGGALNTGGNLDGDRGSAVVADQWGNVYVTGLYNGSATFDGLTLTQTGGDDIFLVKYDAAGNALWAKKAAGAQDDWGSDIAVDGSNDVYITGWFRATLNITGLAGITSAGNTDAFVAKFDTAGTAKWSRKGGSTSSDDATSITVNKYQVYITGGIGANASFSGTNVVIANGAQYIAKYDYLGGILWATNTGTGGGAYPYGITHDDQSGIYVTGIYYGGATTFGTTTLPYTGVSTNSFTYKLNDCALAQLAPAGDSVYMCSTGNVVLSAPAGMTAYAWSTTATTQTISASAPGYYSAIVTYTSGCKAMSNLVKVTNAPAPPAPDICLVTSDSASVYNLIYWEKSLYPMADSFIVYREVSTNVFVRIGAVSKDSLSMFMDTMQTIGPANGDPNITTYLYKLQIRDTCGAYSAMGPYHTSIYFNDLLNGSFTWNTYAVEGMGTTPITTFDLLRDDNNTGIWIIIGSAAGTANVLNDPQYVTFQFIANWRVQANGITCTPTTRYGNNSQQGTIVRSKSNITNNRTTGIKQNLPENANVFPNPFSNTITVSSEKGSAIMIYNVIGECVYKGVMANDKLMIDLEDKPNGIYNLEIKNKKGVVVKKVVKQ